VEIANDGYNTESLKGLYNLYDFATDASSSAVRLFLDLYWRPGRGQLGGVRGGGKTRIYPTIFSTIGLSGNIARLAWFYFGLGPPHPAARIGLHDADQCLAAAARGDRPPWTLPGARVRDSPVAAGPGRARL